MLSNTEQREKLRDRVRDLERALRVVEALAKFQNSDAGLAKARETHQRRLAGMAMGDGGHSSPYKLSQIAKIDPEKEREYAARKAENERAQIEVELKQARTELANLEAVANEYRVVEQPQGGPEQSVASQSSQAARENAKGATPDAGVWRELRDGFKKLRDEESSGGARNWVTASSAGAMTEWLLSGGGESLRADLEAVLTRAGATLGAVHGSTKLNFWLHQLYLELKRSRSKLLVEPVEETAAKITRVTEGSAIFCRRLEQAALEYSPKTPNVVNGRTAGTPRAARNKRPDFCAKDARYQRIKFRGRDYSLTPQAGAIVKVLYEAGGKPIAKADIQSKTQCGKISDSFRSLDGPQVWKKLIEVTKGRKGFYSLHPQAFTHSQ